MNEHDIVLLVTALLGGGGLATIITHLLTIRSPKAQAEAALALARAEESKAKAAETLSRLNLAPSSPAAPQPDQEIEGWIRAGDNPTDYEVGIDRAQLFHGKPGGYIKANGSPRGFCTLMQMFSADAYRGKRVRLTGQAKSDAVLGWAGLWMRVDGPDDRQLGFDNMQDRPIKGTTGWTKYQIVLDVPESSVDIALGFLLGGPGQVWMTDGHFEVVTDNEPTTNLSIVRPDKPVNLSFSE